MTENLRCPRVQICFSHRFVINMLACVGTLKWRAIDWEKSCKFGLFPNILVSHPSFALMKWTVTNAGTLAFCKTGFRNWALLLIVCHTSVDTTSWHNCIIARIVMWYGYTSFTFTFESHLQCQANTTRHVDKTFATCKSFRLEPSVMTESYGLATWT